MRTVVTDIEAQGLVHQLKGPESFLCAVAIDVETEEVFKFTSITKYAEFLASCDEYYFHNGIGYDYHAMGAMGILLDKEKCKDTLVMSRLTYPDLMGMDTKKRRIYGHQGKQYVLPGYLFGSHSLKAWGFRLANKKDDFVPDDWTTVEYSEEMMDYCVQDCYVTLDLFNRMNARGVPQKAFDLEHKIAWLMKQQELNGFYFDTKEAEKLYAELAAERFTISDVLTATFGWWYVANGTTTPKRTINYKDKSKAGLTRGAPYTKIKRIDFNPASRSHVARCFKQWYGWEPTAYTDSGEPKIDAEVLESLPFPEAKPLKKYFDINKTIGQLAEGKNGWLKLVTPDSFIHGSVNTLGTATGRASHARPNCAQIPKGKEGSIGHRCRTLFRAPPGWVLLGSDASGLELRGLGNRLAPYDNGAYADVVVNGDVHWTNTLALGLIAAGTKRDKGNPDHEHARNLSKTWIYAFLYGAGNELLGETVGWTEAERDAWREKGAHKKVIAYLKRRGERVTPTRVCNILKGEELRASFLKQIPAIKEFQKACKKSHKDYGCVYGLDGREVPTRSGHSATNFQLQGDGALVCKLWGVLIEEELQRLGLKHGWDGDYAFCAWVHDEYQIACRDNEIAEIVGKTCQKTMKRVGVEFDFACPLEADYDVGSSWSETH